MISSFKLDTKFREYYYILVCPYDVKFEFIQIPEVQEI